MQRKLVVGTAVLALAMATAVPASAGDSDVVADGLSSPLGFAVDTDGTLFVAEAFAGRLTQVGTDGSQTEIASAPPGSGTAGVATTTSDWVYYTLTLPPERGTPPETALARVKPGGTPQILASLSDYEAQHNPDAGNVYGLVKKNKCFYDAKALSEFIGPVRYKGQIESNPYAVADDVYGGAVVADAAGNSIVRVLDGKVSTVAVLPPIKQILDKPTLRKEVRRINRKLERQNRDPIPRTSLDSCIGKPYASNPVPTDVEVGPDGNYYVSTLPGFPEAPGTSRVFRINALTGGIRTVAKGFTGGVDLAVADDGTIYVAELFAFQVSRVDPGERSASASTFVECPTAVEINKAGDVLVAEGAICGPPGVDGRIVQLHL